VIRLRRDWGGSPPSVTVEHENELSSPERRNSAQCSDRWSRFLTMDASYLRYSISETVYHLQSCNLELRMTILRLSLFER
jgi:hypothetical protein